MIIEDKGGCNLANSQCHNVDPSYSFIFPVNHCNSNLKVVVIITAKVFLVGQGWLSDINFDGGEY